MGRNKNKIIVVTGGAGFIGSVLVGHLNELGWKNLVIFDNLGTSDKWKNLVGKEFSDLFHKEYLFTWLEGKEDKIEAIFHLGACSDTTMTDGNYLLENNYRFSKRLAKYALFHEIRFIYASSAATYGRGEKGFSDNHDLLETLTPLNMYGYSKHLFDLWLKRENLLNRVVGLKYFNVFGPNEYHKGKMGSALLKMVPNALTAHEITLFKSNSESFLDGEQLRDFIYVKDAVRMTAQFLDNDATGIFNIGMGKSHTWNHLAYALIKALKRDIKIKYVDMPHELIGKYQNYTQADMEKSEKMRLLRPSYSLEESVKEYVEGYLLNQSFL